MFSAAGVIAWLRRKSPKKDWLKRMLILSFIMAMVPMLNHLFVLENYSYYTRWFYMPVLLMCLATVKAIEESGPDGSVDLAAAMRITALVMALFLVMVGLTPKNPGMNGFLECISIWAGSWLQRVSPWPVFWRWHCCCAPAAIILISRNVSCP